jgi:PPK2 family polyphosphate:nucleotide phosphotransferase
MDGFGAEIAAATCVGEGFDLRQVDPSSTPAFTGTKQDAAELMATSAEQLSDLQQRLYANGVDKEGRSLLLIVQGMDTAGKGGIMRHVVGEVDPQGVKIKAFKAPTEEELAHHFLWRIEHELPPPGCLGVFDRSHYEDVLNVRVNNLVPEAEWSGRYAEINDFEHHIAQRGTAIVKVMLHISRSEQAARLLTRLERPDKYWKYNPDDVTERHHWPAYMDAYQAIFDQTNTPRAPWHVVPADKKWYSRLVVNQLLLEALRAMDLQWPPATFDIAEEKQRLAES